MSKQIIQSIARNIFFAALLAGSLGIAYYISNRNEPDNQNADQILKSISKQGLREFIKPGIKYFISYSPSNQLIGFRTHLVAESPDKQSFTIQEIDFLRVPGYSLALESTASISNDIKTSEYNSSQRIYHSSATHTTKVHTVLNKNKISLNLRQKKNRNITNALKKTGLAPASYIPEGALHAVLRNTAKTGKVGRFKMIFDSAQVEFPDLYFNVVKISREESTSKYDKVVMQAHRIGGDDSKTTYFFDKAGLITKIVDNNSIVHKPATLEEIFKNFPVAKQLIFKSLQ